jgi:hypothetical protein
MALSAFFRNFYAPSAYDRAAPIGVEETPIAPTAEQPIAHSHLATTRGKQRKAKGMFAWRNKTFRIFVISH